MQTAIEAMKAIETAAATHGPELRMVRTMKVGQVVRQGDIYIERVAKIPQDATPRADRQLAPGSTQGSRHVVEGDATLYDRLKASPLHGPLIDAPERFVVTHPEHAHVSLPSGKYAVTFQRDYAQEEAARVQD